MCGSCWAFATMNPIECNIKISDGINVDLSEQWLVSCNQEKKSNGKPWGCMGGWWVHDYFLEDKVWYEDHYRTDPCGDTGAVKESEFPYTGGQTGENGDCECPYNHDYFIEDWNWVDEYNYEPSVADIKDAIYNHGPVTVTVCVGGYFKIYTGGVYNIETYCPPHGILLIMA